MPNNVVKSLAKKSGKSEDEVEKKWEEAKEKVKEDYPDLTEDDDKFWAIVTEITKRMLGMEKSEESVRRDIQFILGEQGTSAGDIASFKGALARGEDAIYRRHKVRNYTDKFVLMTPDGERKEFDNLEDLINFMENKKMTTEENEEMENWYGVQPDDWHSDGCPVFCVDDEDYQRLATKPAEKSFNLNDDRIQKAIRKANYRAGLSIWVQKKEDQNHRYKWVKPKSKKRQNKDNQE